MNKTRVAVVGAGVSGCSCALALIEQYPNVDVTVFADRPFTDTTSFGPPGIFALDYQQYNVGASSGVQLISGYILSDNEQLLKEEEENMSDIVFNFQWLKPKDFQLFANPPKYGIFFTTFTTEGRTYVPWLTSRLKERKVKFEQRTIAKLNELGNTFDFVINCAGVDAGKIAGDDDTVVPARGVLLEVAAPGQKHFISLDIGTALIPTTKSFFIGTLKQMGRSDRVVTQQDRDEIWERNLKIMPTLKNAKVMSEWAGLRPVRKEGIRLEMKDNIAANGKRYYIVHNYGHGSNGFTLSWGCAKEVVELIGGQLHHPNSKI
uniref:FAD dependent oxidoreductase domain-containing protein n=1 Tax=Plectus sambesii TaxID=2011161 RepID=A0A914VL27_9BILA